MWNSKENCSCGLHFALTTLKEKHGKLLRQCKSYTIYPVTKYKWGKMQI